MNNVDHIASILEKKYGNVGLIYTCIFALKQAYLIFHVLQDLKDPRRRDEMAAARADLRKHSTMLLTASQAFLRHPDVPAARENRDYVVKALEEAMNTISSVSQATGESAPNVTIEGTGELIAALDELDVSDSRSRVGEGAADGL